MTTAPSDLPATGVMDREEEAPAPRTLVAILEATAAAHPDAPAIEDEDGFLTYSKLLTTTAELAARLRAAGVVTGDRVGVRLPSGGRELYVAILAVLVAGAAYVPVDADDPPERAALVLGEADVHGVLDAVGSYRRLRGGEEVLELAQLEAEAAAILAEGWEPAQLTHDAWIIFTSGSTGTPKGVAVAHRSAAAFVDAEADLFLVGAPLAPGDRVLAGLSVAFDASCEEMWLAWRHGACLVPAPRALVRSGEDLGPWLQRRGVTAVSTVPTLAGLWPAQALDSVRLLIFGGEACPPELGRRLASPEREVWNTYGPTEATVVACGARLGDDGPVRIGLPLAGWSLAVVDAEGHPVAEGGQGELVIGGVGLARYLDPAKDAEKYAPMPTLGWERAYRSGDLVRFEREGLIFLGRADDQVKVGGRRIELGEVDSALQALSGVTGAAAAVRRTEAGTPVLVGYLTVTPDFARQAARAELAENLPAALVPLLAVVEELPTRNSGKVDRDALPWPLPGAAGPGGGGDEQAADLPPAQAWLAEQWRAVLGVAVADSRSDFFDLGGGSLAAAQLVSRIRVRRPEVTVADLYDRPRLAAMAELLGDLGDGEGDPTADVTFSRPSPTPRSTQVWQTLTAVPLYILTGARWLVYVLTASNLLHAFAGTSGDFDFLPTTPWPVVIGGLLLLVTPWGRMALSALASRLLLAGVRPGDYRRGGSTHLRLWLAEAIAHQIDAVSLAGAPWVIVYARALGATIGKDVDLHTLPPVTGMLVVGDGAAIEPEVDLAGYWLDGDLVRIGGIEIGEHATVCSRSTLAPGTRIGAGATVSAGSAVFGKVGAGRTWSGSPAVRVASDDGGWPTTPPPTNRSWLVAYGVASSAVALLPVLAFLLGGLVVAQGLRGAESFADAALAGLVWIASASVLTFVAFAVGVVVAVRLLSIGLTPGDHPVLSRVAWQAWTIERLLDAARTILFPLYASLFTPVWLRLLGAKVGKDVEVSTVLLLPTMTTIDDGAFLADDTMVASYELHQGWMRIAKVRIGARAFLGNSGIAGAGHKVPKDSLVAVLSIAPAKAKAGSSWLGSPPVRLRRVPTEGDDRLTYSPDAKLRVARGFWELCRAVPVIVSYGLGLAVLLVLAWLSGEIGVGWTLLASGVVLVTAAVVSAVITTVAKWLIVGPIRVGDHPLWSSFVWRTEVSDTFVEMLAAPWFAHAAAGTPALALWLRSLGAKIGRGVWCDSYWLPEPDLVHLGDGAVVNRGCVVQTHLFHDRVMSIDTVTLGEGATLGPHSVILPAAIIGDHATVGPASLVMRGESVPVGSRWSGNPIGPWRSVRVRAYADAE